MRPLRGIVLCAALFLWASAAWAAERPTLEIFYSRVGCPHCAKLVRDWNKSKEFRDWAQERFQVKWTESREYPLPRVRVLDVDLCGYQNLNALSDRLQQLLDDHTARCRPFPQAQPLPTQVLPALKQMLLAEAAKREQKLRGEMLQQREAVLAELQSREEQLRAELLQQFADREARLSAIDESLAIHAERLNELVRRANSDTSAKELAAVRQQFDALSQQVTALSALCSAHATVLAEWELRSANGTLSARGEPGDDPADPSSGLVSEASSAGAALTGDASSATGDDHRPAGDRRSSPTGGDAAPAPVEWFRNLLTIAPSVLTVLSSLGMVGCTTGGVGIAGYPGLCTSVGGCRARLSGREELRGVCRRPPFPQGLVCDSCCRGSGRAIA